MDTHKHVAPFPGARDSPARHDVGVDTDAYPIAEASLVSRNVAQGPRSGAASAGRGTPAASTPSTHAPVSVVLMRSPIKASEYVEADVNLTASGTTESFFIFFYFLQASLASAPSKLTYT